MMAHINEEDLWNFIDQEISAKDKSRIIAHLQSCPECQDSYQSQLQVHQALIELEHETPSIVFSKQVMVKINKVVTLEHSLKFWLKFTKLAILSAIGLALLLSISILALQTGELSVYHADLIFYSYILLLTCILSWAFYGLNTLVQKLTGATFKK